MHALDTLIRPLLDYTNDSFDLQTVNNILWCYPFIFIILGDLSENAALTLTFNSANCSHPCHACLIEGNKLNNAELSDDQIVLRTTGTMKAFVDQDVAQQYSLHDMKNIFWRYP